MISGRGVPTLTALQFAWILARNLWWLWVLAGLCINSGRIYQLTRRVRGKMGIGRIVKKAHEDLQKIRRSYPPEVHPRERRRPA